MLGRHCRFASLCSLLHPTLTTNMAPSPPPKLGYLPNHRDALQAHMHFLHKLGNAKTEANYHAYYQTLIKDGTANGAVSNAYLTSSDVPFKANLPPLPTSRQYPAHPFWVPTHTNKEYDHRKTQRSMPHDL